jgi:anthranilate phosphoribosyltransferase
LEDIMVGELLNRIIARESLTSDEAAGLMAQMMDEELTPIQMGAFLVALRSKGETADEVVGFARTMRSRARHIEVQGSLADTCGTGGDGRGTFNISTAAALIVAASGQRVAKHGNRAASGRCGSADVLETMGVDVALPPEGVVHCIDEAGIGFLFAPAFHPAMKFAAIPRRELGVRTVFNLLGPLTNPAGPRYQLLGVSSPDLLDLMAYSLLKLGVEAAFVVHSSDGTDEITVGGATMVRELRDGEVRAYEITPEDFGLQRAQPEDLLGGDPEVNAAIMRSILEGHYGPTRDAAVMNAAAALYVSGQSDTLQEGAQKAAETLDSGAALRTLEQLRAVSQKAATQK